jgi:hypothetical protein
MAGGAVAKHYKMSELKQKLMRPAQTSVYMVSVQTNTNVNSFTQLEGRGYSPSRHEEMINLACCEASLPGSSLATHEVNNDYHGSTEKMVYRRIYDDTIDLTFYVDYEYAVIKYFQGWMNYIVGEGEYFSSEQYKNPATFYRMKYPDGPGGYKSDIHLVKFEKDVSKNSPRPTIGYQFIKAFPINIVSIPVSYDASDLLKMTVSFAYTRYVITNGFTPYTDSTAIADPLVNAGTPAQQAAFNKAGNLSFNPSAFGADLGFNPVPGAPELSGIFGTADPTRVFQQSNLNNIPSTTFQPNSDLNLF